MWTVQPTCTGKSQRLGRWQPAKACSTSSGIAQDADEQMSLAVAAAHTLTERSWHWVEGLLRAAAVDGGCQKETLLAGSSLNR